MVIPEKENNIVVVGKDGTRGPFIPSKIEIAITKSASRALVNITDYQKHQVISLVEKEIRDRVLPEVTVKQIHAMVEDALDKVEPRVAKSYRDYRNFKAEFANMMDVVYNETETALFRGDKENANKDSSLNSTKKVLASGSLFKEMYRHTFLSESERNLSDVGYIYIHDQSDRLMSMNCCLFRMDSLLKGGFEMANIWYNEPKTLKTAFDVASDVVLSAASQQYGGFTIPQVDKFLAYYAEKSYKLYYDELIELGVSPEIAEAKAEEKVAIDYKQGFQGWEYKFNTVSSSRGDYPFITVTSGLDTSKWGKLGNEIMYQVHMEGQGKPGFKRPVLFPKYVFLYDEELHKEGGECHDVYLAGLECSQKTMYPDWLSLTGEGYVPSMYKQYKAVVSPMGCEHGKEVVVYKINEKLFVESFERFWNRCESIFDAAPQPCDTGDRKYLYIDVEGKGIKIYDTKEGFVDVKKIIRNYSNEWVTVKMSNGRSWLCTKDHPFEIEEKGVVFAKDLSLGDKVAINNATYSEETKIVPDDYAWLLGFMMCDGCYQNYSIFASIALKNEDEIEEKFKNIFEKYFGLSVKTVVQNRGKKGNYKDLRVIGDGTNKLSSTISELTRIFGGVQKKNRQIPNEVFSWNYSAKMSFLAGIIDADGYIVNGEISKCKDNTVQIGSTNKELAIQQMYLAQAVGYPAKIYMNHYSKKKLDKIRYQVSFCGSSELANYIVCGKKKNCLYDIEDIGEFNTLSAINEVIAEDYEDYSYDVETSSGHFECSGVYSHNCRAFLSPYYERGGQDGPADENDKPIFEGRFNSGAISLNLPLIYINSLVENRPFYDVLDEILETIRNLHKRTKEYIGNMAAGTNPLSFTQGGFYGGNLRFDQKLKESKELMDSTTYSFGITALDELQYAYNGKSIAEDGRFALQVMEYINDKITEFKHEDHMLYAIYGTPAESLCFEGNTVVQCYGGNKKIKDIVPGDIVFSYNEDRHCVELKKVTAQYLTKKNAQVVKVILDNGQEVICTPNHPFAVRVMDRDAQGHIIAREHIEYVNASELKAGMRLKSNYFMYDKNVPNRKMCSIYKNGRRQLVQDIVAEYALGAKPDGFVTHHKDENPENNTFENLEYKTGKDHRIHHLSKTIAPFQYKSEDVMGENNPFYGKHHTEDSNMKNRQAHIGKSLVRTELDGSVISRFECADNAERAGFTRHLVVQACKGLRDIPESNHFYKNSLWFYEEDYLAVGDENHKVVSVEYLTETADVYDITVEDNHNFFVGGDDGILVHNCGKQIKQLRKYTEQHSEALKEQGYEIVNIGNEMAIKGVCDREYVTNSFHCNVREDITPIQKQDLENRFWNYANGGKIQYVNTRGENIDATDMLIRRGMKLGFYQGVNHNLSYCDDCGYEESGMNTCPHCGSNSITKIDRMNGYLAYSRVKGDSRLNSAKMAEIGERVSM